MGCKKGKYMNTKKIKLKKTRGLVPPSSNGHATDSEDDMNMQIEEDEYVNCGENYSLRRKKTGLNTFIATNG